MILLSGHSLTSARKVPAEALSLQLKERDSTATMNPADMTGISINSWMQDEKAPGKGIVWIVRAIRTDYATRTPVLQLEHAISLLKDKVMFGEITYADITGNSKATTCTAEQAVRYILSKQSDWVLGTFGYSVSNPYKFDGETLFDALEIVSDSLEDAWWSYDFSTYPFKLNISPKPDGVQSEMRASRNLKSVSRSVDKSGMFTRFYPIGKDDLHLSTEYVEKNTAAYGVISKIETDSTIDSESELRRWATEQLNKHAEPSVTIDVDGLELADATGESMDRLVLGTYCRVPLPEFDTTILERIVALSYSDKVHQPELVRVTLSNNRTDITKIIADALKKSGRGGRAGAKRNKEDLAWFEDTNDHVAMCAKGIVGTDAQGNPNWTRLSQIYVDGTGIHQTVEIIEKDVENANTRIDQNEYAIELEAKRASDEEGKLSGRITVTADAITQEVSRATAAEGTLSGRITTTAEAVTTEVTRAKNAENTLSGRITVTADSVTQIVEAVGSDGEVTAASICVAINNGGSSATINASKIYLLGQTIANTITADYIDSKISTIGTLHGIAASFSGNVYSASALMAPYIYVGSSGSYVNISDPILAVQIDGPSNNTYKLQYKSASNSSWTDAGTFSRATTLSGAWSGGVYTVTASPQGNTNSTTLRYLSPTGDVTVTGKTVSRVFKAQYGPDEDHLYDTGFSSPVTIDATNVYNNGYAAAHITSSWNSNNDTLTVTKTTSGSTNSASFGISATASATYNSTTHKYTAIAQAKVDGTIRGDAASYTTGTEAYTDGYNAGAPSSATAGARSGSTYNWSMVVTKGDGTTTTLTVDCTAIYTDARTGYTQGTFTAEAVYISSSSGTTYYKAGTALTLYTAGTATTYYQAGTTTKYARGNTVTVTPVGNVRYFVAHTSGTPDAGSTWYTMATTKPSSGSYQTMYFAGTAATYYKGDGGSFTVQGSSVSVTPVGTAQTVTPIDGGTALPLVTATRYKKS